MKPILFPFNATAFNNLGLGVLREATSCMVTEERNGIFELEMIYPRTGRLFSDLVNRNIIYAPVDASGRKEPFRIYKIGKVKSGLATIYAAHISYDLSGEVLSPFTAANAADAVAGLKINSTTNHPFTFWTDKTTAATFKVSVPSSVRSVMGGSEGSLLDIYGGEYGYDKYTVRLYANRGANRGVTIRYGKNLVDLQQEENIQNVYTGVYPFWASEEDYIELTEKIVPAEGNYGFVKIRPLDASYEFEEKPTAEQLRNYAKTFMKNNDIGIPSVSISVSFVPLEQSEEYKNIAPLQKVLLCDTVSVKFEALDIDATAKCVKTVFDVLKNRYDKIELGEARANIADTIANQAQELKKVTDPGFLQAAVAASTQLITGNKGGYVVLHSSTGGSTPDEILVMDTADITTATQVWRWNKSGLGYSKTGYNGPYSLAMTMDGQIVADFMTTGTLNAAQIKVINLIADQVKSVSGESSLLISGAKLTMMYGSKKTFEINNTAEGLPIMFFMGQDSDGTDSICEITDHHVKVGGTSTDPGVYIRGNDTSLPSARRKGTVAAHGIGAQQINVAGELVLGGTKTALAFRNGSSWLNTDNLQISGSGNCQWVYLESIGRYVLAQQ